MEALYQLSYSPGFGASISLARPGRITPAFRRHLSPLTADCGARQPLPVRRSPAARRTATRRPERRPRTPRDQPKRSVQHQAIGSSPQSVGSPRSKATNTVTDHVDLQRQLPTDGRLPVDWRLALIDCCEVQRTPFAAAESRSVQEDARAVDDTCCSTIISQDTARRRLSRVLESSRVESQSQRFNGSDLVVEQLGADRAAPLPQRLSPLHQDALTTRSPEAPPVRSQEADVDLPHNALDGIDKPMVTAGWLLVRTPRHVGHDRSRATTGGGLGSRLTRPAPTSTIADHGPPGRRRFPSLHPPGGRAALAANGGSMTGSTRSTTTTSARPAMSCRCIPTPPVRPISAMSGTTPSVTCLSAITR